MKFALACDSSRVHSYICNDKQVYLFDGTPYYRQHHLSNKCMMGFWNFPLLFDGYFINLNESFYPDEDIDLIFAAIESDINNLYKLKSLYPNAVIIGTIKEQRVNISLRNELIDNTDAFVSQYLTYNFFEEYQYKIPDKVYKIPQPLDISYIRANYLKTKKRQIFDYSNYWVAGRSGYNQSFLNTIQYESIKSTSDTWNDFLELWSSSKYMVNIDPTLNFGQQAVQCAALETIMIGGLNDSHKILYPNLSTCDINILCEEFFKLENDTSYYQKTIDYALNKVGEIYSLNSVKNQINDMYYEITKRFN